MLHHGPYRCLRTAATRWTTLPTSSVAAPGMDIPINTPLTPPGELVAWENLQ